MPTENRSSDTDQPQIEAASAAMAQIRTMLGREQRPDQVAAALEACDWSDSPIGNKAIVLSAIQVLRATQPHPDPLAWMVGTAFWWTKEEAERDAAETGLPIVGLGPMADAGEAERLRVELSYMREERDDLSGKLDRFYSRTHGIKNLAAIEELSDKLAERDSLLGAIAGWTEGTRAAVLEAFQDGLNESASYAWYDAAIADLMNLVEALSASAEPSNDLCAEGAHEFVPFRSECVKCGEPYSAEPGASNDCAICRDLGNQCMECEEGEFRQWADRHFAAADYRKTDAGVFIQDWMRHSYGAWCARGALVSKK